MKDIFVAQVDFVERLERGQVYLGDRSELSKKQDTVLATAETLRQHLAREGIPAEVQQRDILGHDWTGLEYYGTDVVLEVADEDEARAADLVKTYLQTAAGAPSREDPSSRQ